MGRATVVSEYGAGQYRVAVTYDRSDADTRIAQWNTAAANIRANLPGYQVKVDAAVVQVTNAQTALTSAMTDYQNAQAAGDQTAIAAAYVALGAAADQSAGAQNQLLQAHGDYNQQELRATALERQATTLGNNLDTASREVDAWCADYTEGLTGQVGTIEVGRIGVAAPIVHPGGAAGAGAAYSASRDGEITQTMALHPGAAFHSLAMLPGVNTWRPRYRLGEITAVDTSADTVDVDLDAATSPHQALDVNQSASLSAVAADYMGLGASLYVVGDRVVVGFTEDLAADPTNVGSWSRPSVVGFESSPAVNVLAITGPDALSDGAEWALVGGLAPFTSSLRLDDAWRTPLRTPGLDWDAPPGGVYREILINGGSVYPYATAAQLHALTLNGTNVAANATSSAGVYSVPTMTISARTVTAGWGTNSYLAASASAVLTVTDARGDSATKSLSVGNATAPTVEGWNGTIHKNTSTTGGFATAIGDFSSTVLSLLQSAFGGYIVPAGNRIETWGVPAVDHRAMDTAWGSYINKFIEFPHTVSCYIQPSASERPTQIGLLESYHVDEVGEWEAGSTWPYSEWIWVRGVRPAGTFGLLEQIGFVATSVPITYP